MSDAFIQQSVSFWRAGGFTSYQEISCWQFQSDLDAYRGIIRELRPSFIIEIGAADGGTALFLADALKEVRSSGVVISIDIEPPRERGRVIFLQGDSISAATIELVDRMTNGERGLVLIDGDHRSVHVARELELYAKYADYLIVEDTIMEWLDEYDDGPLIALIPWLRDHPEFRVEADPCPTQHPGGYLRRIE